MDICKEAGDVDEILFSPDGKWTPLGAPQSISLGTPIAAKTKPAVKDEPVAKPNAGM